MGGRSLALLFAVLSNIIFHMTDMFHKLLPLTASDNIHQVILNCCDYKGSTKYTDLNLEDLNTGRSSFMERRIGPLLYADITYTYLALDLFTAFPMNPFTAGCNGPMILYPTLWLSDCMMVSGDYVWLIWCAWTTLLWWYYQTIACFDRNGFSRLFSKTLVCLNLLFEILLYSAQTTPPRLWFPWTIPHAFARQLFTETICESSALPHTTVTVVKSYTHSLQFSLLMPVSAKDGSYYAWFVP